MRKIPVRIREKGGVDCYFCPKCKREHVSAEKAADCCVEETL